MLGRCLHCVTLTLSIAAAPAYAQSLGELARQEEARRAAANRAVKTYSNATLGPGGVMADLTAPESVVPDSSCYMSKREGKCVPPEALLANTAANYLDAEKAKQKPLWERDAANIRLEAAHLRGELDRFYATAADQGRSDAQRAAAEKHIAMTQPLLERLQQRWARLEKRLKDLNYPRQWIEPVPDFSSTRPR